MAEGSDISFVASYKCPHCGAWLEGKTARADAWLRCPGCGKASQAPDHAVTPTPALVAGADFLVNGPAAASDPTSPRHRRLFRRTPRQPSDPGSPFRVGYAAALFVAVVLLVFSFLDQSSTGVVGFSCAAAVFLVLLAWPVRTRERA